MTDNPLLNFFETNPGRQMFKWRHYFEIYHRHFSPFRGKKPIVIEIGVNHGGSLQMWKEYFGDGARIVGIDNNPQCKKLEEKGIEVFIGDQADRHFLRKLANTVGSAQIIIDDGGHMMKQQITSFEELFPMVTKPGVYLVEDLHTSYWKQYGGGIRRPGSFMEFSKKLVDQLTAWHMDPAKVGWHFGKNISIDDFTRSVHSMTYYDSVLVIEKRDVTQPESQITGHPSFSS